MLLPRPPTQLVAGRRLSLRNLKHLFALLLLFWLLHTARFAWHVATTSSSLARDADADSFATSNDEDGEEEGIEEDDEEEGEIAATVDVETSTFYDFSKGSFWATIATATKTSFVQAKSWSDGSINWFALAHCAVFSPSVNDRIKIVSPLCCPAPSDHSSRLAMLRHTLTKLDCAVDLASIYHPSNSQSLGEEDDFLLNAQHLVLVHQQRAPNEAIADRSKIMTVLNAKQLFMQQSRQNAHQVLRVEDFSHKSRLALLQGKHFVLRALVFPVEDAETIALEKDALLGYFTLAHILQAELEYGDGDANVRSLVPSKPNPELCLEDIPQTLPLPVMMTRIKQLLALLLVREPREQQPPSTGGRILGEPLCVDFEWDKTSRVLLSNWAPFSQCALDWRRQQAAQCSERDARFFDFQEEDLARLLRGAPHHSLRPLTRKQTCANSAQYESLIATRARVESEIQQRLFGPRKTLLPASSGAGGIKCAHCEYINHAHATRCDLCGARLQADFAQNAFANNNAGRGVDTHRERLTRAFQKYDPSRLSSIDVLLERYEGEEEELVQRVEKQYRALNLV